MKLTAVMPVRNEACCLGLTARAALMWCDELVFLNHASTDATAQIIADLHSEFPGRVGDISVGGDWDEMQHRQTLLTCARAEGATHIAIVDADEILTGNLLHVPTEFPGNSILQLPGYNLRGSLERYHSNGIWGNRWFSVAFKDHPSLHWAGDRFHHREPMGMKLQNFRPVKQGDGGVMHLWGVSERRLKAKHALYKVTERLRFPGKPASEIDEMYTWAIYGKHDSSFGTPYTWTYADVPASWWQPYAHLMKYLDIDAEPWQEAETRRLVAEHGAERFKGLDLFGVA